MKFSIPTQLKAVLVLIAMFSFAISYNNLHAMALEMGIPYYLAWFFPLCIDLFLIACSIFILYAEENCPGESREGWVFLISYTVLSIWYNVLHSPPEFWYQVGFAICPISLCVSLHLFIKVVKHEMGSCPVKDEETEPEHTKEEEDMYEYFMEEEPTQEVIKLTPPKNDPLTENQVKVLQCFKNNPGVSWTKAVEITGLSYKTVKSNYEKVKEMI
jgi:hypothetical protein